MSPMDKVALDLYAISISQGTQKLFGEGEDVETSTEGEKAASTEESEITTEPVTGTSFKSYKISKFSFDTIF